MLLGAALPVGPRRFGDRLPRVPEGDVLALTEPLTRVSVAWGAALERAEGILRQWPLAGISLLALIAAFGAALLAQKGVPIIELVDLEELARDRVYEVAFIGGGLKLRGADAAPMRPVAFRLR